MIYQILIKFLKKNIHLIILYLLTLIYLPLNKLGMPHIYGKFISKLKESKFDNSMYYFIVLIVFWGVIQGLIILSNYFRTIIFPKLSDFTRQEVISIIIDKYKTNYEDLELGNTITKIIKTPWLLHDIFYTLEDFVFRNIIIIFSSFGYLYYYNSKLGLIYIACMCMIFVICYLYTKSCYKLAKQKDYSFDEVHEEIEDTLSNLISIYTSQKVDYEKKRLNKISSDLFNIEKKYGYCNNKFRIFYTIIFIIVFIVLNGYSYYIFRKDLIKLDTLISIIIINYSLLSSFMTLYYDTNSFIDVKGRLSVFNEYINNLPYSSKNNILKIKTPNNLVIKFVDVGFYYKKDKYILKNFNLTIKNEDIIAIIGSIGSGKSTIAKLLSRLNEYQEGKILISKYELNTLNIDNLRTIINYIPQHPKLFNRTLFQNITYGIDKKIDVKEIYEILDKLNVTETTKLFKKNMFKNVGKNGSTLSGGQRQIVWLIRAVLKNSKAIILDEPTASLDQKSKIQIIKFIKEFSKNKIVILITHDMELLKYVNRIIKLDKGKIISDKKI